MSNENELIEYVCSHCGSTTWIVSVLHDYEENKTLLLTQCSNERCLQNRETLLQPEEDTPVSWGLFDITGQGFDPEDMEETTEGDAERMPN